MSLGKLRGLRIQIILWTILPLTLVLIGIAFTGVYSHQRSMRALVEERDRTLAQVQAALLGEVFYQRAEALHGWSHDEALWNPEEEEQLAVLIGLTDMLSFFDRGLALFDAEGDLQSALPSPEVWLKRRSPVTSLVGEAIRTGQAAFSPLFTDETLARPIFLVAVPLGDGSGVLMGASSLDSLSLAERLGRLGVGRRGVIFVIDSQGHILYHPDSSRCGRSFRDHSGLEESLRHEMGSTIYRNAAGEEMVLSYATVEPVNWRVVVEEPWEDLTAPILRFPEVTPLVAVLAAALSVLTIYFGVRYIVRPLQVLGERADRVAWGDFAAIETPVGGVQEIEDLRGALYQMAQRIQSYQAGMRDYIAAITQGQEEERKRLARELHDDTVQALIALSHRIEMARKALGQDLDLAVARLDELKQMTAAALQGVRRFSRDLRPVYLEDLGFLPALEMLVRDLDGQGDTRVTFRVTGSSRRLAYDLELAAFRIAQEALNNAARHAQATQVSLTVAFGHEEMVISVEDDGVGFTVPERPDDLTREGHFGLMGIRERALLFGGHLTLHSELGKGTKVEVVLPTGHL